MAAERRRDSIVLLRNKLEEKWRWWGGGRSRAEYPGERRKGVSDVKNIKRHYHHQLDHLHSFILASTCTTRGGQ